MKTVFDFVLGILTGGLWWIWLLLRYVNGSKR